ncbi:hypothetical protein KSC_002620 [Ktedonobacter sp. SOSP1-52]|uniref:hypothetical protein n=1 Tax=Ktedonobacter sp. SOSP1-52 TaxID=2778366 RepID=UPI001914F02B|nr:hypothetical protein [Ktedonobacter sp. SOSP1-52]GHO61370.1 hypothetical protein KSC_002620 [Ktedonobacter sp. SOSP1-52]
MHTLPNDVLFLHYADLSSHAELRLRLLGCIGSLLNKQIGFYTLSDLNISLDEWVLLKNWIAQGNAANFWQVQNNSLQVKEVCTKHVLIGTHQLLGDLRLVSKGFFRTATSFDLLWRLARDYVLSEITLEMGK